jgi:hypothetical protein
MSKTPKIHPIATAPRDGSLVFAVRGSTIAMAAWSGDMWAFSHQPNVQRDFEPTGWVESAKEFLS